MISYCNSINNSIIIVVHFVIEEMSSYYERRLVNFAHFRDTRQNLYFEKVMKKAEDVRADLIEQISENLYSVRSATKADVTYVVDVAVGICSCDFGLTGRFCKHQAAIYKHHFVILPNFPAISDEDRYLVARLALGERAESPAFYQSLNVAARSEVFTYD